MQNSKFHLEQLEELRNQLTDVLVQNRLVNKLNLVDVEVHKIALQSCHFLIDFVNQQQSK